MRVFILGIGDAFTRLHFGSSALIEGPHGWVLLDCPDPIHRAIHEATSEHGVLIDARHIDDVIVTHLHGDHCNGLESFGFWRWFSRRLGMTTTTPRLHVTAEVASRVWGKLAPAMDASGDPSSPRTLADYFDLRVITPGEPSLIAGLRVETRSTRHPVPTVGVKISDGRRTLGWSGDTPFEPAHVEWLADADLIVHETNLGPAHTPIESLNSLPDDLRRKMRLIHMADDFDPACSDIPPLRDRELLVLE